MGNCEENRVAPATDIGRLGRLFTGKIDAEKSWFAGTEEYLSRGTQNDSFAAATANRPDLGSVAKDSHLRAGSARC